MRFIGRWFPKTITAQLMVLVVTAVLLGSLFTLMITVLLFDETVAKASSAATAVRIATITHMTTAAASPAEVEAVLATARRSGVEVEMVRTADVWPPSADASQENALLVGIVGERLEKALGIKAVVGTTPETGNSRVITVKLDDRRTLAFKPFSGGGVTSIVAVPATFIILVSAIVVLLLSVYAVRWITAPLSKIAAAAQSFGRSPNDETNIGGRAPREIAQVATALVDMRMRIRALLDDRTRMLAAISHDLRTPLTRMRLRAERVADPTVSEGLMRDINNVSRMVDETLLYLRAEGRSEQSERVDLPSLLQTICAEFADVGHEVEYAGPKRLAWPVRTGALARAVTILVENGLKHGSHIAIDLRPIAGAVEIDVSDDGPGIPADMREQVFEPFFKASGARSPTDDGFGLGLTVARDIARSHGGEIALLDRPPRGFTARITLPVLAGDELSK